MEIRKLETDDDPFHDDYARTRTVWFENGGRIRFVETNDGTVVEQVFHPSDTDTVWDDAEIDGDIDPIFVTSLEVWFKEDFPTKYWDLGLIAGENTASPTNLRFEG